MLRENEDVFQVFTKNVYRIRQVSSGSFAETLVNFLFNDLTNTQILNRRFLVAMREIIRCDVQLANSPDELMRGMTDKIFKELIK